MKIFLPYIATLFFFFLPQLLLCQDAQYSFKRISVEQGLSQNSVYTILQDSRGFMWFGTKDGLNRYDGYTFTVFRNRPGDTTSLANNFISALYEDKRGRIWVGTQNGHVHFFDRVRERFTRVSTFSPLRDDKTNASIVAITEDDSGTLWIGTNGGGLLKVISLSEGENKFHVTRYRSNDLSIGLRNDRITALIYDNGILWIAAQGYIQFLTTTSTEEKFSQPVHILGAHTQLFDILRFFKDSRGEMWIGSEFGLHRLNREEKRFEHVPMQWSIVPQGNLTVRVISEDNDGMLWIGMYGNVYLFNPRTGVALPIAEHSNMKKDVGIATFCCDKSGAMWLGSNGEGIFVYHSNIARFQSYTEKTMSVEGWNSRSVRSLFEDSFGQLWVGSYGGLYRTGKERTSFSFVKNISSILVRKMIQGSDGTMWFATQDGIFTTDKNGNILSTYVHQENNSASLPSNYIESVYEDRFGTMWAVTDGVISKLNKKNKQWTHFQFQTPLGSPGDFMPVAMIEDSTGLWFTSEQGLWNFNFSTKQFRNYNTRAGLNYNVTLSLCSDPNEPEKYLWIGTAGGGLNRLEYATGNFMYVTEADGLPNNVVYGIISDAKHPSDTSGHFWLSTNKGIARFNPATGAVSTYVSTDGLQSNEYNAGAYCKGKNGEIIFGGINGFDIFEPEKVRDNPYIPDVVLTELRLFNLPVKIGDATNILPEAISEIKKINLSYSQNIFSLTFASLDFSVPEKNKYRYMLEGFNEKFIEAGTNRTATYTNLDPGTYTFRVQGTNSDGIWGSKEVSLSIVVLPPFWMTWWFRTIGIVLFLSAISFVYRRKVSILKREKSQQEFFTKKLIENQEQERKRIAGELHDSLGQNLLVMKNRALLGLQDKKLSDEHRSHLAEISNTASATLKEVRQISHNLRPYELDRFGITEAIVSVVEKVQSSSVIRFTTDIHNIDELLLKESEINLYRIVQECVSNIVKHSEASAVEIRLEKRKESLHLIIKDNGKGFERDSSNRNGIGLTSLDERVRIINGNYSIDSFPDAGTTITINIPYHNRQ